MKPINENSENDSLEKRFFEYACLLQFSLMAFLGFQTLLRVGWVMLTTVDFGIALLGLGFYYLSNKGFFSPLRFIFVAILLTASVYFWMTLGGVYGTMSVGAPMAGIMAILVVPKSKKLFIFILFVSVIIGLSVIQYSTDWIVDFSLAQEFKHFNYVLLITVILYITFYVKSEYDKEKLSVHQQNLDLITLNQNLEKTNQELENTLKKLGSTQGQLVESEKMASVGRMTAALAHELNNPLNYVAGGVLPVRNNIAEIEKELDKKTRLKTRENFVEVDLLLHHIGQGSSKIANVVANLVKISTSRRSGVFHSFDLSFFLKEHVEKFISDHPHAKVSSEIKTGIILKGHTVEIIQAINELLENAIESQTDGGTIDVSISLHTENETVIVSISDNGQKITKLVQTQMFDPFYTTKSEQNHIGLGLYFVYGVAKKHRGEIIYQRKNERSCFDLILPIA